MRKLLDVKTDNLVIHKYDKACMDTVKVWQQEAKATRRKVSAAIFKDDHLIMVSYNGLPPGADDSQVELVCPDCNNSIIRTNCNTCQGHRVITNPEVHHAERNALDRCAKEGISVKGAYLYVTLSPCLECAKSILASGISRVVYEEKYRITNGIEYLKKYGVTVEQYKEYYDIPSAT